MKKILLLLAVAVSSLMCAAQITSYEPTKPVVIGTNKTMGTLFSKLEAVYLDKDTMYTLTYKNDKYRTLDDYRSVSFGEEGGTLSSLYDIMKSFFNDEHIKDKEYTKQFKLGQELVTCKNYRLMGTTTIMFYTSQGYFNLSEKQLNRLFGR